MREQPGRLTFRLDGITVTCEQGPVEGHYLLRTLSNSRPRAATIVVRLEGEETVQFALRPFQKRVVYPPLAVAADAGIWAFPYMSDL